MKVLLTGANGFIGRYCLPKLLSCGYEVHAVSSSNYKSNKDIKWHHADLLDPIQTRSLLQTIKPTHILHLAWCTHPPDFWSSQKNLSWLSATLTLMQEFSHVGGIRFVSAGTCAEYDWNYDICSERSTPCNPRTLYGVAKYSTHLLLQSWSSQCGFSSAWGRVFFLYGPGEHYSRLVPSIVNSLIKGVSAPCSHGNQVRDFMFVDDVAAAFIKLLDSDVLGPVNIASGSPVSLKTIITAISQYFDKPDLIRFGAIPRSHNDPDILTADVSRLKHDVGFTPLFSLHHGITLTIESIQKQLLLS